MATTLTGIIFLSCNDDEKEEKTDCKICGVTNPLTELEWLKAKVAEFSHSEEKAQIYTCIYQNDKQGFLIANCAYCPDAGQALIDCNGIQIGSIFGITAVGYKTYEIDENSIELIYENF